MKNNGSTRSYLPKRIITVALFLISFTYAKSIDEVTPVKYRVVAHQVDSNHIKSTSNTVKVISVSRYYIPSAFSPNGDGLNDTFGMVGSGILKYNLQVFNRWGEMLFESNNIHVQWDGTYKNKKVPEGTYVYKIIGRGERAMGIGETFINASGTVTLVD